MLVREGYELAFEEIVRRYRTPLGRYAAAIVGGRSEDVTQDAFSKALLAMRRDDSEIDLSPWLYRIVRNTALNDLRDRPAAAEELAEAIAGGRSPAEAVEEREELTDLITRLQALPQPQRAAIVMRELEGLSHDEIAAALGLSGGAARQAIYRARQTLRDGLGMLVPLPALKALLSHAGPGAAEAAAGAAGVGGAAGAGVAFKATAATVLVAGAVGAGIAVDHGSHPSGAHRDRAQGDRVIARQSPSDISRPGAREAAATSTPDSAGEGAASGGGGGPPEPGAGSGGDTGARAVPVSHRPGTSGHGGSGGNDGTAHQVASGPQETSDDSRHGDHGASGDDGIEQLGDGPEHQDGADSGSDTAEQTSGGDGASTESDHEESHLEDGGGGGGSDGGDSATVDESSTSVSDH